MTTTNTFASNKKSLKIDPVTFNKLTAGCLVLAYVLKVDTDRLIVSLPGSATGVVLHHEISDVLHRMHTNKVLCYTILYYTAIDAVQFSACSKGYQWSYR